ncbi:MAG: sulfatase-like hydrolase/transferase [Deltaproteobacteria bacterium]|nr:sulfatase-like hydrolase/transferase [Deltaproteobacteria bacterium]
MPQRILRASVLLGLFLATAACPKSEPTSRSPGPSAPAPAASRAPDVLLITLDTARADHFSTDATSSEARLASTPVFATLAREGALFTNAQAPVPLTLPSHATILTGRLPEHHRLRVNGAYQWDDALPTLAERLKAAGYTTGAFLAAAVLDARFGLDDGFDHYDDEVGDHAQAGVWGNAQRPGTAVIAAAARWLEAQPEERPTFAWVHLFDAHHPYACPKAPGISRATTDYGRCIEWIDHLVGRLLEGYRRLGRYQRAVIALTSDHGESLGEHGERTHGIFLYQATQHVPLILRLPGTAGGLRIDAPIQLADLAPTLLAALELPRLEGADGIDLGPALRGEGLPERILLMESYAPRLQYGWHPLVAARSGTSKLVRGAVEELYDLEADPAERKGLEVKGSEVAEKLRAHLELEHRPPSSEESLAPDSATQEELGALGYVWHDPGPASETAPLADPRDRIGTLNRLSDGDSAAARGNWAGALSIYEEILAAEPRNAIAARSRAAALRALGRLPEAARALREAITLSPPDASLHHNLGQLLVQLRQLEDAEAAFGRAVELDPGHHAARGNRWNILFSTGRRAAAITEAEAALAADPKDGEARLFLILAREGDKGLPATAAALERARIEHPEDPDLREGLVKIYRRLGREADARALEASAP